MGSARQMGLRRAAAIWLVAAMALVLAGGAARASESTPDLVEAYCRSIHDEAMDARYRLQSNRLMEMARTLEQKTIELRSRIKEYRGWYELRQEFTARATEKLVGIFSGMRAEAAASQLTRMPIEAAAALVLKLDTDVASAVLSEMKADHAARLAGLVSDAAGRPLREEKP